MKVSIAEVNKDNNLRHTRGGYSGLYQGDILLTNEQIHENKGDRSKRQAYHNKNYPKALWSNGISYEFRNTSDTVRRVFLKAANIWSENTCIDIREDRSAEDKVNIIDYGGCFSHLGKIGGGQILSLGNRCAHVGIALHQLGHTIGLFHTQTRHDRDNFITPHYENLIDDLNPGWYFGKGDNQFDMESPRMNHNYKITYDFGTVMDYGATAFAKFAMSMCMTAKTR
ncbi:Astacin (Peptidase M12A) [Parelaphostrongylus tenuis]|uniref:Metalloendopeptidase n=1 Tax=Parelaphostrongylus tenuis TaxID=148309 RepID=A0AAD5QNB5_PARTN|nr:Astacin (Peptidase M12A) [Parelaphostrongylus tenuis]